MREPAKRELQMQLIDATHERQVNGRHRLGQIVHGAPTDVERCRLLRERKIMLAVDHRFALSNPALLSAPSKKSFSSVSSPIFAWSDLMSTSGVEDLLLDPDANTSTAPC
jgi:hypothetical protein